MHKGRAGCVGERLVSKRRDCWLSQPLSERIGMVSGKKIHKLVGRLLY